MRRIFAYFSLALILGVQLIRAGNYYNDDSLSVTCYVGYSEIPCYNGASCKSYSSQCLCAKGFTGRNCQKNIDECEDADCGHGVCEDGIGTYTCKCDQGYTGEYCDEDFDECESNTHECQNGAECVNSPKGSYMCTCPKHEQYQYALFDGPRCELKIDPCSEWPLKPCSTYGNCVNTTDSFECQCNKGHKGPDCSADVDECALDAHKCQNGATCVNSFGSYSCQCPLFFYGEFCENRRSPCDNNRCTKGSKCRPISSFYTCICPKGKTGLFCNYQDPCDEHPCSIDGKCVVDLLTPSYTCECVPGITGKKCEVDIDECAKDPCHNNGTCVNIHGSYRCECDGFYGQNCEYQVHESADRCVRFNCSSKAQNGRCDVECNVFSCAFDGGDCSVADERPFSKCAYAGYCSRVFRDGHCNPKCNTENCLFDGFDCDRSMLKMCSPMLEKTCAENFGNRKCNRNCNTLGCGWDGGDCMIGDQQEERLKLKDYVALVLLTTPDELFASLTPLLMMLNRELKALITVAEDSRERKLIFHWDNVELAGDLVDWDDPVNASVNPKATLSGLLVKLSVDTNICHEWSWDDCFTDVHSVASYLMTPMVRESFETIGLQLESAFTLEIEDTPHHFYLTLVSAFVAALFVVLFSALLIHTIRRRRSSEQLHSISLHFNHENPETVTVTTEGEDGNPYQQFT